MKTEKFCGTCKWHIYGNDGDFVCSNSGSDCYSDWTEYEDCCDEWEER